MSDVLRKEFQRLEIHNGADIRQEVYELPYELRDEYLERIATIERFEWTAKGQMAKVIDGQVSKDLVNLSESLISQQDKLRVVEINGRTRLMHTVDIHGYGELVPHGDGRLYAGKKSKNSN